MYTYTLIPQFYGLPYTVYIYSVRVFYTVRLDGVLHYIKCTLLYYFSFFGNVIVLISQYRLSVGNYRQPALSDRYSSPFCLLKRDMSVYIEIYI